MEHAMMNELYGMRPAFVGQDPDAFLFTSWAAVEDMSLDDLTLLDNYSINWLGSSELEV